MAEDLLIEPEFDKWGAFVPPGRNGKFPWSAGRLCVLGFVLFGLLATAVLSWAIPHFQQRLDERASSDLAAEGVDLSQLSLDWEFRDVVVNGQLPWGVTAETVEQILAQTDAGGVRDIKILARPALQEAEPAEQKGSVDVAVTLDEGQLLLEGTVLNDEQRNLLQACLLYTSPSPRDS